ncbi:MAG TPA: gamma-glutamyltransferase, partial [Steroidobacteraceae bacterium]|nr:gamma-glutamyltransferase [Steroidobacteraceae bacterium]
MGRTQGEEVMMMRSRWLIIWVSLFAFAQVNADDVSSHAPGKAAIASAHPLATQAGMEIIKRGGNAFDAAVAITAALAVIEPNSSGLGGGGFYLLHRASDNSNVFVDARETAPAAATRDMFLDKEGNVIEGASRDSAKAAGIPGEVAAMAHLAERYGKLPLRTSLQPAIKLAHDGFELYPRLRGVIDFSKGKLKKSPFAAKSFLQNGETPALGFKIKQPQLAKTLQLIADKGSKEFYEGELAKQMVKSVREQGGIWSDEDLKNYRVSERVPLIGKYHDSTIITAPPPSSGGVALINILNILSGYDFSKLDSATRKHLIIESMRRAYRDRGQYLGDPDFVHMPIDVLTNSYYAAGQRSSINPKKATPSALLPDISDTALESPQTTHFSVIDADGNRVAATITVNLGFGSGLMLGNTGIFMNNEMDDFSVKAGVPNAFKLIGNDANAIAPNKRMLSSMSPTFIESDKGVLILGTPGGSRIISMVLLGILDWFDGNDATHIAALKRFHHQYLPDVVSYEPGAFSEEEIASLKQRGDQLKESGNYGNMEVVTWLFDGNKVEAAADP